MTKINRTRRAPFTLLCSRLTLAAFLATLNGPAAWSQAVGRAATAVSGVSGVAGASLSAPAVSVTPLSAPALSAAPLAAPIAGARAVAAAPAAAVAPAAASAAAPLAVAAPLKAAAYRQELPVPVSRKQAPSAKASLEAASTDMGRDRTGSAGNRNFDGAGNRGGSNDGNGGTPGGSGNNLPAAVPSPSEAPYMVLNKHLFPGVNRIRFAVNDEEHAAILTAALNKGGFLVAATAGSGTAQGHNTMATLVKISNPERVGGRITVVMEAIRPARIAGYKDGAVPTAKLSYSPVRTGNAERVRELASVTQHILDQFAALDPKISKDLVDEAIAEPSAERLTNLLAQELPFSDAFRQELLAAQTTETRLQLLSVELMGRFKEAQAALKAKSAANDGKKAGNLDTVEGLKAKMEAIGMPAGVQETTLSEFQKLAQMNPKDSEGQKIRTYIEWLVEMPWSQRTEDNFDMARARAILNRDHDGLEKVKERVLEFLALRKKTGSKKGAIIAFTGPPGVGKTSIASAIAEALGRKFVRLSLGGVSDETVIRGHGRTYLGSMPGEIMRQMKAAGTVNPVMLMDEVDKIGRNGNHGDPTAALLEVLDPSQNNTYRDRYLDVPYDLSEVLFVVTANDLPNIPEPLRDRMEIIQFDGYTTLEKISIAEKHVIPQKLEATGLKAEDAKFTKNALRKIIEGYTMESGVRSLRQKIEAVLRKISAWTETRGEKVPGVVDEKDVEKYLGVPEFSPRETAQNGVGVATGLAVNAHGGSTLNVEVSVEPGSGQLKLRKQFGDDIEDSAKNALKFVKTHAAKYGLGDFDFTKHDIDINITPAGKVDGPSAGGLMVTAIISALTKRPVTPGLAMTGEITMRGDILPIGGLKQKVMAAHRMGYTEVIFPYANLKDIEDIPKEVRDGIKLKAAKTYDDIYPDAIAPAASATAH